MKEKLTRNIGLKILSVILAAIVWLVITNVDDPVRTEDFINVPVDILNEDAIASLDQVYEIVEGDAINFSVAARRSIADNLTAADFRVTADFAKLSDVNAVTINITSPRYGDNVTITEGLYQVMKVNREERVEKNFKVTVVTTGEPAEGYFVGKKAANTIIKVSGPKSKIERIEEIVALVDVAEVSGSFRTIEELKALDKDGNEIESNLEFSESSITINIGIYKTKSINLRITTTGEPAVGYRVTNVEYQPRTIEVAGENDVLERIRYLSITESISGASQTVEKEINLQEQLGDGLTLVGEDQMATVIITIEKTESKEVIIWPGDIEIRNKPANLNLTFITTGTITLTAVGPPNEVSDLGRMSIRPYIDLSNYSSGTYVVEIKADLMDHTNLVNNSTISIYLAPLKADIDGVLR